MSWVERLKNRMKITTGDGRVYEVFHQTQTHNASFEFNVSEFEFPEVKGTKVDRRERKGVRYPLEFYFQGEDVTEQRNKFLASCEDKRFWVVMHPIYGKIFCHPISVSWDDSGIHSVKFNVLVVETIIDGGPRTTLAPGENVFANSNKAKNSAATAFVSSVNPNTSDVQLMKSNVDDLYKEGSKNILTDIDFNKYTNFYNDAVTKINSAFNDASVAVNAIQSFINYPSLFSQSVKARLQLFLDQANHLSESISGLLNPSEKKIFENQKATLIASVVDTVSSPIEGDYGNAIDVLNALEILLVIYNQFIGELQGLQSTNGIDPDPYIPDPTAITDLQFAVNYAVSNLLEIALEAKQERIVYLEEDSNVIVLAHRFYGLLPDDSTIQKFMDTNEIKINETFQVKKGRKIKYYV